MRLLTEIAIIAMGITIAGLLIYIKELKKGEENDR